MVSSPPPETFHCRLLNADGQVILNLSLCACVSRETVTGVQWEKSQHYNNALSGPSSLQLLVYSQRWCYIYVFVAAQTFLLTETEPLHSEQLLSHNIPCLLRQASLQKLLPLSWREKLLPANHYNLLEGYNVIYIIKQSFCNRPRKIVKMTWYHA